MINETLKSKATYFRGHCLARAKKEHHDKSTIPMPKDIAAWIAQQLQVEKRKRFYFVCYLTGECVPVAKIEIDHKTPVARGGNYGLDNLAVTSKRMNCAKGTRTEEEFKQLLELITVWEDGGKSLLADLVRGAGAFGRYK